MELTDIQKKYGLTLWPSAIEGHYSLRGKDGLQLCMSDDKHEINRIADAYTRGALDWVGEGYPIGEGE